MQVSGAHTSFKAVFPQAAEMTYAYSNKVRQKASSLITQLAEFITTNKANPKLKERPSLFFKDGSTVAIPDIHGDFIHLIFTLHRHGLLDKHLNLKKDFSYVCLGDIYDRGYDADVVDYWLNIQIQRGVKIHRLVGNHEMSFFARSSSGDANLIPGNDIDKDKGDNYQVTKALLESISKGNLLAAYLDPNKTSAGYSKLYVHSFVTCTDYEKLGQKPNLDVSIFVNELNTRFRTCGEIAYQRFMEYMDNGNELDWKAINKPFKADPLFDIRDSMIWRRTQAVDSDHNSTEIKVEIPNDVYQTVGHTPIRYFIGKHSRYKPLIVGVKTGNGQVQFTDVGIGYSCNEDDLSKPKLIINPKRATIYKP